MPKEELIILREKLRASQENASNFIRAQIRFDGRLYGGCEGRPLETVLAIHLFRDFPAIKNAEIDGHCESLLAYCRRFWQTKISSFTGTFADIDSIISHMLLTRVIDDEPAESIFFRRIPQSFNAFAHPSNKRKRILFSILLAEMGVISFHSLSFEWEHFSSKSYHLFAAMIMTSAKILYAVGHDNSSAITNEDVRFLLRNQSPNGGWENHVLLTLVTLMALAKIGASPESVSRGVNFIVSQIRPDGSVPFIVDEDTWVTCMAGFVLNKADHHHPVLPAVARYIAGQQRASGGWCYTEGSKTDDTDDLSICMAFLKFFDANLYADSIRKGEAHLLSLQNEDGGFPAFVQGAASEVELTAKAVMALCCNTRQFDQEVSRAVHWLNIAQETNGSFRMEWKLSSVYPVAQVMYAMRFAQAIGSLEEPIRQIQRRCVDYTLSIQNEDGGWSPLPRVKLSSVLSTAYALIALCSAEGAAGSEAIRKGAEYLLSKQDDTGEFISAPDSLSPRPIVCDVRPLSTIYPLWAISDVLEFISSTSDES